MMPKNSFRSTDENGNSSILTFELRSLLKDCTEQSNISDICLSSSFKGKLIVSKPEVSDESDTKSKKCHNIVVSKLMQEDIDMMSKEIEQIRDRL